MSIAGVAHIEPTSTLDEFVVEVERHFGFRVAVDEPEEVGILILDTILCVVLLA